MYQPIAVLYENTRGEEIGIRIPVLHLRIDIVHLEERRTAACRIEHVTLLIIAVESRLAHSVEQVGSLSTGEDSCGENSHLSLKHFVKRRYCDKSVDRRLTVG